MSTFLTARWENLVLITYSVSPEILKPLLPFGIQADTLEGQAFVSFVAFDFLDTRLKGFHIPFHVNFPEINLRYYVRHGKQRGVMFVRELVPRKAIAWVARAIYNEPYLAVPMRSEVHKTAAEIQIKHRFSYQKSDFSLDLSAQNAPFLPKEDSVEHFFKEHEAGYGLSHSGKLLSYRVEHPFWRIYPVVSYNLSLDFGKMYGPKWAFLNKKQPFSVVLAEGSPIKVFEAEKSENG
jgi:uncharacterized protein